MWKSWSLYLIFEEWACSHWNAVRRHVGTLLNSKIHYSSPQEALIGIACTMSQWAVWLPNKRRRTWVKLLDTLNAELNWSRGISGSLKLLKNINSISPIEWASQSSGKGSPVSATTISTHVRDGVQIPKQLRSTTSCDGLPFLINISWAEMPRLNIQSHILHTSFGIFSLKLGHGLHGYM